MHSPPGGRAGARSGITILRGCHETVPRVGGVPRDNGCRMEQARHDPGLRAACTKVQRLRLSSVELVSGMGQKDRDVRVRRDADRQGETEAHYDEDLLGNGELTPIAATDPYDTWERKCALGGQQS